MVTKSARLSNNYSQLEGMTMGYISQVGPANAEEGLTPNTQNHTTVWNVGNTSPVKDTTNNSK